MPYYTKLAILTIQETYNWQKNYSQRKYQQLNYYFIDSKY